VLEHGATAREGSHGFEDGGGHPRSVPDPMS
jgi:hypothetical protein